MSVPGKADPTPVHDHVLGGLLGGALGEAVARVRALAALERGAEADAAAPPLRLGLPGAAITVGTRTQLTLFVAEGTARFAASRAAHRVPRTTIARGALLRWSLTQGGRPERLDGEPGALVLDRRLHARRGVPGAIVERVAQLPLLDEGSPRDAVTGGDHAELWALAPLLRAGPWGVIAPSPAEALAWASETATLTSSAATVTAAAGAVAALVHILARGGSLADALDATSALLVPHPAGAEVVAAVVRARLRAHDGPPDAPGDHGVVEVLEYVVACCLTHVGHRSRAVAHALWLAAAPGPAAMEIASLLGLFLGATYGARALPEEWLVDLELIDVLGREAHAVCGAAHALADPS